jgi:hypothetical protein
MTVSEIQQVFSSSISRGICGILKIANAVLTAAQKGDKMK